MKTLLAVFYLNRSVYSDKCTMIMMMMIANQY